MTETLTLDTDALDTKVREMYRAVAERPDQAYHFEMGRPLAERLGYPVELLDRLPAGAVDSFAGVGYFLDLAGLASGERVLDLGSGSGMDTFAAALAVGTSGQLVGIDMTPEQLHKAEALRRSAGFAQVQFVSARMEQLPFADDTFDAVISNGVVNLAPSKDAVFAEVARVLRPGGRMAIADIVSQLELPPKISCNAELWASCIGGAAHRATYEQAIEMAGLTVEQIRPNPYQFLSDQARHASLEYGVTSVSLLARQ
jgi:arsenite methyltransferase